MAEGVADALIQDAVSLSVDGFVSRHAAPGVVIQVAELGGDGQYHTRIAGDASAIQLTVEVAAVAKRSSANAFSFVSVGRAPNNDIVIRSSSVSKCHACFEQLGDDYRVRDAGSTNGIDLNGSLLGEREARTLASGDRIRLSKQVGLKFLSPEDLHAWIRKHRDKLT